MLSSPPQNRGVLAAGQPAASASTSWALTEIAWPENATVRALAERGRYPGTVKRVHESGGETVRGGNAARRALDRADPQAPTNTSVFTLVRAHSKPLSPEAERFYLTARETFIRDLAGQVARLTQNNRDLQREPVNVVYLHRQQRVAQDISQTCQRWASVTAQVPRIAPGTALDTYARKGDRHFAQDHVLQALSAYIDGLSEEASHLPSLQGVMKCAEKLHQQSRERIARVPPELQANQWELEQRRALIDALVKPEREAPRDTDTTSTQQRA